MPHHSNNVDTDPGYTVIGYQRGKVKKNGSHRKLKPEALSRAFSSWSAANEFAACARNNGDEVIGIREIGNKA